MDGEHDISPKKITIMSPLMGADFDVTNWSPTAHQSWSNTGQTLNQTEVQYGPFLFSVVGHHWRGLSRWDSGPPWTRNCLAVWLTIPWRVERSHIPNHFHESSKRIQGEPWVLKILIMMAHFFSPWDPEIPSQTSSNDLGIPDFLTSWVVNMNLEKVSQDREVTIMLQSFWCRFWMMFLLDCWDQKPWHEKEWFVGCFVAVLGSFWVIRETPGIPWNVPWLENGCQCGCSGRFIPWLGRDVYQASEMLSQF